MESRDGPHELWPAEDIDQEGSHVLGVHPIEQRAHDCADAVNVREVLGGRHQEFPVQSWVRSHERLYGRPHVQRERLLLLGDLGGGGLRPLARDCGLNGSPRRLLAGGGQIDPRVLTGDGQHGLGDMPGEPLGDIVIEHKAGELRGVRGDL